MQHANPQVPAKVSANAAQLEELLKEGSLARRLVAAYRSTPDGEARRKALLSVMEETLQTFREKSDGSG